MRSEDVALGQWYLTDISSDRHISEESAPAYNDALRESVYVERVEYMEERKEETGRRKKNRRHNITWYNPPFSKNVATDIAHKFLRLLDTHFPHGCRLRQIFNRNNVKVSYSCMPNMSAIVKSHNNHVQRKRQTQDKNVPDKRCNCRDKSTCPMDGDCQVRCIVYKATVQHTGREQRHEYLGLTEPPFKQRYNNHMSTTRHERMEKSTELSKCIWKLKRKNTPHSVKWAVVTKAQAYSNATKWCPLCLAEELEILEADKTVNINKRSELVSKCRHEKKYYLSRFSPSVT